MVGAISVVTEKGTNGTTFFEKSVTEFSDKINMASVQKPGTIVKKKWPGRFLLSIRWKVLVIFRYVIIDR